jgi:hypothetical protein
LVINKHLARLRALSFCVYTDQIPSQSESLDHE